MSPQDFLDAKIEAKGELTFKERFWKQLRETLRVKPESEPLGWYDIRDYDLGTERTDFRIDGFPAEGDTIFVLSISSGATASIKFNSAIGDSFALDTYEKIRYAYTEVYLTNDVQEDMRLKILFARGKWDLVRHYAQRKIVDAETVDGIHASASRQANMLLALGADAMFPDGAVRNIQGGLDADKSASPVRSDMYVAWDTSKVYACFTAGAWTDITPIPGAAYWNVLLGSLDNEQYVPFKNAAGIVKEILKVTSGNETQLKSAGGDIVIEPGEGKGMRVVRRYF